MGANGTSVDGATRKGRRRRRLLTGAAGFVAVLVGGGYALHTWYMAKETLLFEVGSSLRGHLEVFAGDLKKNAMDAMPGYFAADFRGTTLGFAERKETSRQDGVVREDWHPSKELTVDRDAFVALLAGYRAELGTPSKVGIKMVFLDQFEQNSAETLIRMHVYGHHGEAPFEDIADFYARLVRDHGAWRFAWIRFEKGQRVANTGAPLFADVTADAGIDFKPGVSEIFKEQRYNFAIVDRAAGGVTSGDFDNDGLPDLFMTGPDGSKLYKNAGGGRFVDVTAAMKISDEALQNGQGTSFADYDNDGYLDLYITKTPNVKNRLLHNEGDGSFRDVTDTAGVGVASYSTTAGWADIDGDGDLDLFVGVYGNALVTSPDPPFHDRFGEPDHLFRNNGDGTFTDVTEVARVGDTGWALGMTFLDYDGDADQDIYVANDFGPNTLYRNDGKGVFEDVSLASGALDYGFGMSASPGDYDNDGDLDIYVSNIYSGTTWYIQNSLMHFFYVRAIDPERVMRMATVAEQTLENVGDFAGIAALGKKMGEGNSLLENKGDGTFASVGVAKGVNMAGWAWGSNFVDFDNDGDLDIHAVNGWISQANTTDL